MTFFASCLNMCCSQGHHVQLIVYRGLQQVLYLNSFKAQIPFTNKEYSLDRSTSFWGNIVSIKRY